MKGRIYSQYDGTQVVSTALVASQVFTPNNPAPSPGPGVAAAFNAGGQLDECIVTYDAGAANGLVWVFLIGGSQGVVPANGWTPGSSPAAWTPSTAFHTTNTFIQNPMDGAGGVGPPIYWYLLSGGTSGTGTGPVPQTTIASRNNPNAPVTYQSTYTDGTAVWALGSDPTSAAQLAGGPGTSGPYLLEVPVPVNHAIGLEDTVSIVEDAVKYFGGCLAVVSTTKASLTIANITGPYAWFSFKGA